MVVVGVVPHGDRADGASAIEGQGSDGLAGAWRKELLFDHHLQAHQAATLAPVGHQGQRSGTLEASACDPVPGHGEGLAGLQPAFCGVDELLQKGLAMGPHGRQQVVVGAGAWLEGCVEPLVPIVPLQGPIEHHQAPG